MVDYERVADQVLYLDGPYDVEAVREAAALVAELVRRLNHATRHVSALPCPGDVYRMLGSLNGAVWGLGQLFGQIADRLDMLAVDPQLTHDRLHGEPGHPVARQAAEDASDSLRQAGALSNVKRLLEAAWGLTSSLYLEFGRPSL